MKRFLSLLVFLLVSVTFVAAQCGNNGNGGNNGNNANAQQAPIAPTWQTAHRALQAAVPYFQQELSLSLGQLIQRYFQGLCTITLVTTNPPTNRTYRVASGGFGIVVVIDDI
jgi:hypothetical protein